MTSRRLRLQEPGHPEKKKPKSQKVSPLSWHVSPTPPPLKPLVGHRWFHRASFVTPTAVVTSNCRCCCYCFYAVAAAGTSTTAVAAADIARYGNGKTVHPPEARFQSAIEAVSTAVPFLDIGNSGKKENRTSQAPRHSSCSG